MPPPDASSSDEKRLDKRKWWIIGIIIAIVVICIICIVLYTNGVISTFIKRPIQIGGFTYRTGFKNSKRSAERLAKLNQISVNLINLVRKRLDDYRAGNVSMSLKEYTTLNEMYEMMRHNYNPDGLEETVDSPLEYGPTSYTLDKGKILSMCLQNKLKEEDDITVLLVLIHELTHLGSIEYGHEAEFRYKHKLFLKTVAMTGLIKEKDMPSKPVMYCDHELIDPQEYRLMLRSTWNNM